MFGHVAGRQRRWRWVILSFLFALAFVWSFAVMREETGGIWSMLRLGSAVAGGISLLGLVLSFVPSKGRGEQEDNERPSQADGTAEMGSEEQAQADGSTEGSSDTDEEVFDPQVSVAEDGHPSAGEGEEWPADDRGGVDVADPDGAVEQGETHDADVSADDHLQRMREQFKARAEEAALRVKQREAELQKTASASDSE